MQGIPPIRSRRGRRRRRPGKLHRDIDTGDGEVSWIIRREDLLAQRFDRVMQSYYC
ncbi:hypothetical protein GCM10010293_61270 [Streptomyces griseoflavus]|nr:hypothetical protein GCM10010293_61270 [Streptomyces griseoflavus]